MSIRTVLLAAAGTTALGVAQAQDQTGYYGSASAGYAWEYGNNDFESDSPGFPTDWDTRLDTSDGLALAWALGKYFENNFRGEMEVSWRLQDIEAMPGERPVGEPDVPGDGRFFAGFPGGGEDMGSVKVTAFMANILKDFPVTDTLTPYIGAGIGVANIGVDVGNLDDVQTPVTVQADAVNGYRISLDDNDLVPAVQLRAGAAYKLTEKLTAELGYRFLQTAEYDLTGMINDAPAEVSGTYRVHESLFTLRYDFGGKTARRAAAATSTRATKTCFDGSVVGVNQPCPELAEDALTPRELRTVVYFGLNSADLTSTAEA
ncbi:MAG: outer membrane beta-barrel protein, partial [Pseudomonadota bacterium]